jgi:uncharacterized protein YegL
MSKKKVIKKIVITTEEIIESNEYTHIICLLDKSGSMGFNNIIKEARGSVNSIIKKQKEKNIGKATISIHLFDDTYESIYTMSPLEDAKKLTEDDWDAGGMTRLYDGIGITIRNEKKLIADLPKNKRPDKILFVITTDGDENNSKEFQDANQIKKLINKQEKEGWKFIYTAAGKDAFNAGTKIGISAGNTLSFGNTKKGYSDFNVTLDAAVTSYRSTNTNSVNFLSMCDSLMSDNTDDTVKKEDEEEVKED